MVYFSFIRYTLMNILKYNVCYSYFCLHPLLIHFWLLIRFKYNALFLSLSVYRSMNRRNDGSVLVLRYPPCRPKETWLNAWKLTSDSLLTGLHTSGTLDHNSVSLSFVTSAIDCLLINSLSSLVLRGNSNHKSPCVSCPAALNRQLFTAYLPPLIDL